MVPTKRKAGRRKNRKHGRNKMMCQVYRREHRREKAKVRRIKAHLAKYPQDRAAVHALSHFAIEARVTPEPLHFK